MSEGPSTNSLDTLWKEIRLHLEGEKDRLYEAIKTYPPPITGCDEQFDYLLRQRDSIAVELTRLHEIYNASRNSAEPSKSIEEFIRGSSSIGDAFAEQIRSSLTHEVSHQGSDRL